MRFELTKLVKVFLLITFLSLAPIALLSQDNSENKAKGVSPPNSSNSIEGKDGLIRWRYQFQNRQSPEFKAFIDTYIVKYLATVSKNNLNKYVEYPEQNAIIFTLEKKHLEFVRKIMNKIDSPRRQVRLDVQVESITYESQTQVGWEAEYTRSDIATNPNTFFRGFEFTFHPDDFITALTENAPGTGAKYWAAQDDFLGTTIFFNTAGESVGRIGGFSGAYRLLAKTEKVKLLAQPFVIVEAGYEAVFQTGEEVPVSSIKTVGTSTVVSTTFETVGIKLTMKPRNIGIDYVELEVKPEVSAVSRFYNPGGQFVSNPVIISRNAYTPVTMKTGETMLIGGLESNRTLINSTGIPVLSDIPLVGYLFQANRKEVKRQDIVFTITPTIIPPGGIPATDRSNLSSGDFTIN